MPVENNGLITVSQLMKDNWEMTRLRTAKGLRNNAAQESRITNTYHILWCFPYAKQTPVFKSHNIQRLEMEHLKFKDAKQDNVNQEQMIKTPQTEQDF